MIDLLYGLPGQSTEHWQKDLLLAADLAIDGIDCYQLNVFEKSPLARQIRVGKMPPAATLAEAADLFSAADEVLECDPRWERISNTHWRRTSKERNVYNALGKSACDCLAFGCGAGGKIAGHAFMQERSLAAWSEWVKREQKPVFVLMKPTAHWHLLRTLASAVEQGAFDLRAIGDAFGVNLESLLENLLEQWTQAGLLIRTSTCYEPTRAGRFWHVTMAQFLVNALSRKLSRVG